MNDPRREILSQVAAGTISAEEGAARLEALESNPPSAAPEPPAAARETGSSVKQVRLEEGDTMVIEQTSLTHEAGFTFSQPRGRVFIPGFDFGRQLTVRMNPSLPLSAKVQAGNLSIRGLQGAVKGDVQAGNCSISEFRGPLQLNVTAGNVTASGRLEGGASAIRCKMGEVQVVLEKSSSVRITAHAVMGEVSISGVGATSGNELTLGSGDGTLDCDCTMGTVHVAVE
ncbi:MAG: DUF2089 domain-containing protein [Chloroflexi bacterium]|nr:MAG: DUF2089 domain-containing protein [Chloroflexota bacterium]